MKTVYLTLTVMLLCASLWAQSSDQAIVFSTNGKVKYAAPEAEKAVKISAGQKLDSEGNIELGDKSSIGIYFDGEYAYLLGPASYHVHDVLDNADLFSESRTAEIFGRSMDEALHPYFGVTKLKREGFAVRDSNILPPPKGSRDGHNDKIFKVVRVQPTGGFVSGSPVLFRWTMQAGEPAVKNFNFEILSSEDEVLFETRVKGLSYELEAGSFTFEAGKVYKWRVSAASDPEIKSKTTTFKYVDGDAKAAELKGPQSSGIYKKADSCTRMLIRAVALEKADFVAEAGETLRLASKRCKKNELASKMYRSFLWRHDLVK